MIVLLTDRPTASDCIRRDLSLIGPCELVPLHTQRKRAAPASLIVTNVALDGAVQVEMLQSALARHRQPGVPLLCLLDDTHRRTELQAFAIGATAILNPSAGREQLIVAVIELIGTKEVSPNPMVKADITQAGAAIAQMMDDAAGGTAISQTTLVSGADLVLQAIKTGGIRSWLDVVWNYDDTTYRHSLLVAGLSGAFALKLGFGLADRRRLTKAALLHDIGKARIPIAILNKPGHLTREEMALIRTHAQIGHEILVKQGGFAAEQLAVVRHHHEYLDGSGYPDGLTAERIPDLVRLVTICDIYAALIEKRPYKEALGSEKAVGMMCEMVGKLDMELMAAFRLTVTASSDDLTAQVSTIQIEASRGRLASGVASARRQH